jgi:cytochrome c556
MRYPQIAAIAVAALTGATAVVAQDHSAMDHQKHMAMMMDDDSRQAVAFPAPMRQHTLANMRDHMQALSDILDAIAMGQYDKAARIADARLGMQSPAAAGCKTDGGSAPQMSMEPTMEQQMAQFMPEGMRKIGLDMHQAASTFASEAAKVGKGGDAKPAMAALSRVTQQCAACHTTYRLQ